MTTPTISITVKKSKIAENGEYNLTGDRYRETVNYTNTKWPMVELGEVFKIESGGTPDSKNNKYWDGEIKWATLVDIPENIAIISETKRTITEEGLNKSSAKLLPKGTVLVSSRATIGRIAITGCEMATNQGFKNILIDEKNSSLFVAYMLSKQVEKMNLLASGGTFKEISKSAISTIQIPLPPLEVQEQIVAEIEGYQKVIDGAKQVVENWKPSFRIDPSWEMVELGEVCEIKRGFAFKSSDYIEKGILNFRVTNIGNDGKPDLSDAKYLPEDFENKYKDYLLKDDDFVIVMVGATTGKMGVITKDILPALLNQNMWRFEPLDLQKINKKYLFYIIGTLEGIKQGGARDYLKQSDFIKIQIPLPPLEVQEQIVAEIEAEQRAIEECKKLIEKMEKKIEAKIGEVWGSEIGNEEF